VLKETARLPADALDAAEFRHGPLELAGPCLAVAVVTLEPTTGALDGRLLADLAEHGSAVLAIGRPTGGLAPQLTLPAVDPLIDTAVAAVPLQLLAWRLSQDARPRLFQVSSKTTVEE
jgi:glutamine---fructose-6-phosphate transaminase (isomerizing)